MAVVASSVIRELVESRQAEVEARSTLRVPGAAVRVALGAALASVSDEQVKVRGLAIDGDNDLLSAVKGRVGSELRVVHGNDVVGVDIVKSQGSLLVAHNWAQVLGAEGGTAGIDILDIVVVGTESSTAEDGLGSESTSEEGGSGEN